MKEKANEIIIKIEKALKEALAGKSGFYSLLPEIEGTEKQIEYANLLRIKVAKNVWSEIKERLENYISDTGDEDYKEELEEVITAWEKISTETQAKNIIENWR
jgi:hypothetical protein